MQCLVPKDGGQTKPNTQAGSVSPMHIAHKARTDFATGWSHVSQTAMPQHNQPYCQVSNFAWR